MSEDPFQDEKLDQLNEVAALTEYSDRVSASLDELIRNADYMRFAPRDELTMALGAIKHLIQVQKKYILDSTEAIMSLTDLSETEEKEE